MSRRPPGWRARSRLGPSSRGAGGGGAELESARCAVDPGQSCRLAYQGWPWRSRGGDVRSHRPGCESWSRHDFRSDPGLPGLAAASDRTQVSQRLTSVVEEPILLCRVRPVRYRPGARCVLRYDVRTASGSAGTTRKCSRGRSSRCGRTGGARRGRRPARRVRVTRWLRNGRSVHDRGQGGRGAVRVRADARPFGIRPEPNRPGQRLGGLLADLHTLSGVPVPRRTASGHLRTVTDLIPAVRTLDAALADRLSRLLDRLGRTAASP